MELEKKEKQMIINKNKIIVLVLSVVIVFGAGFVSGCAYKENITALEPGIPNTFEAGWEAAKKKVEETPYIPVAVSQGEVKSIKGRIIASGEGQIIIEARLLNPLDDEQLKTRTVKIDESVEITIREEKDRETIRKEHDEYNKTMEDFREGKISGMPPAPEVYIERIGAIEDLEEGQTVTIESEENIREALEFRASKVLVR